LDVVALRAYTTVAEARSFRIYVRNTDAI